MRALCPAMTSAVLVAMEKIEKTLRPIANGLYSDMLFCNGLDDVVNYLIIKQLELAAGQSSFIFISNICRLINLDPPCLLSGVSDGLMSGSDADSIRKQVYG